MVVILASVHHVAKYTSICIQLFCAKMFKIDGAHIFKLVYAKTLCNCSAINTSE